ncbi:MAG: hypothetical protein H8E10_05070 [Desulfobacterales bacterium]|nr:hypothetical protein [Desulfobacterales bacterium]
MWKSYWNKVCGFFIIMGAASLVASLVASAASVYVESSGSCGGNAPCYSTIQAAIDAASSGNTIKIAEGSYDEALSLSSSKDLTLQGGWDSTFTSQSLNTTVKSLTISNGSIEVDKLILQDSGSGWTFTEDNISLGISGVSPEAVLLDDGSVRLYVTGGMQGMTLYKASDGLTFTEETASPPQGGADPTLIKLSDGTYRMYYRDMLGQLETICTAISPDGLSWTKESTTWISNTSGREAWGVPDSVELPDGRIRLYWVDTPPECPDPPNGYEVIKSAISSNGLTFTEEGGYRTEGGYVDPYVLVAEEGNWIGLFSLMLPDLGPMKMYIGTSTDGLTWSIESDPIISVSGGSAIDPTAVPLGDGSYRVYYGSVLDVGPEVDSSLKSGILKPS